MIRNDKDKHNHKLVNIAFNNYINKKDQFQPSICHSVKLKKNFQISFNAVKNIFKQHKYQQNLTKINKNMSNGYRSHRKQLLASELSSDRKLRHYSRKSPKKNILEMQPEITIEKCQLVDKNFQKNQREYLNTRDNNYKRQKKKQQFFKKIMNQIRLQSTNANSNIQSTSYNPQRKQNQLMRKSSATQIKQQKTLLIDKAIKYRINRSVFTNSNLSNSNNFQYKVNKQTISNKIYNTTYMKKIMQGKVNAWEIQFQSHDNVQQ